jgi:hypothetical protein
MYPDAEINPLGDWTGGTDVDTGATNRKLGSDMADSVTGGGLHGKDLSKGGCVRQYLRFPQSPGNRQARGALLRHRGRYRGRQALRRNRGDRPEYTSTRSAALRNLRNGGWSDENNDRNAARTYRQAGSLCQQRPYPFPGADQQSSAPRSVSSVLSTPSSSTVTMALLPVTVVFLLPRRKASPKCRASLLTTSPKRRKKPTSLRTTAWRWTPAGMRRTPACGDRVFAGGILTLLLTGFDEKELSKLFDDDGIEAKEDDFDVAPSWKSPPSPSRRYLDARSAPTLICGDSTKEETYAALMGGTKANLVITDPPYNVNYEGSAGKIKNDNMADGDLSINFLLDAFTNMETPSWRRRVHLCVPRRHRGAELPQGFCRCRVSTCPAAASGKSSPWCWDALRTSGSTNRCCTAGRKTASTSGTPAQGNHHLGV